MTILFHRPTPWSSNITCSTKIYSKLFSESNYRVIYLQSSINLIHWVTKKGYFKVWNEGSRFEEKIWVTSALSIIPYYDQSAIFSKQLIKLSYLFSFPKINNLIKLSGYSNPKVIWTTVPGSSILKDIFPGSKLIFHCVDNYAEYRGQNIRTIEKIDYEKADHIFVIGEVLRKHIKSFNIKNEKITNLGQGVDLKPYTKKYDLPEDFKNINGPIGIWVGVLEKIDIEYLKVIANTLKKYGGTVVLLGPINKSFTKLFSKYRNIHFLGSKKTEIVPRYLTNSDFGIMTYNRNRKEFYKGQHPLKLYEYAAAKLPIISTWHDEFETLKPPVIIVRNEEDVRKAVQDSLENSLFWQENTYQFALENSWEKCKKKAETVISELIKSSDKC